LVHKIFFIDRYLYYAKQIFNAIKNSSDSYQNIKIDFIGQDKKNLHWLSNQEIVDARRIWTHNHYVRRIFNIINQEKPSLVHFSFQPKTFGSLKSAVKFPVLLLLLKLTQTKILITLHDLGLQKDKRWEIVEDVPIIIPRCILKQMIKTFFKMICDLSDHVVVDNKHSKDALNEFVGVRIDKISIIYFGFSKKQEQVSSSKKMKLMQRFGGKKIILCFGIISPRKGHITAIKAMKKIIDKLPEYVLVITGKTNVEFKRYEKELHELVNLLNLNDRVIFTGFLDDEEVEILFEIAEIVLYDYKPMSSISNAISFAIQQGKATVISNIDTFKEIVDKDQAIFVEPNDEDLLAESIVKIAKNEVIKSQLENNIKKIGEKYTWNELGQRYLTLYKKLIKI